MNQYKLLISYDGTGYHGWQFQKNQQHTIAGVLIRTFKKTFGHECSLLGASRTDAGVHAYGQVACLRSVFSLDAKLLLDGFNRALPNEILIRDIEKDNEFHPHVGVVQKKYVYHFFTQTPLPFYHRFGYFIDQKCDLKKLESALRLFIGTHDFRSFITIQQGDGSEEKETTLTIDDISLSFISQMGAYRITILGKSFMRHMIRRIVGASLEIACRDTLENSVIIKALEEKKLLRPSLFTAPSQGLTLHSIFYD
ncbi:MAG TPA: tRNA pseudouridine(38-40) synthase TruA [Candidatus Babeliales bacterium]|nr:tRNA pseudouridine(38-40) synthase TruA [Candidatus Babeliales bacterium]